MSNSPELLDEWQVFRHGETGQIKTVYRTRRPNEDQAQDVAAEFAESVWMDAIQHGRVIPSMLIIEVRRRGERNMRPFAFLWKVRAQPVVRVADMPREFYSDSEPPTDHRATTESILVDERQPQRDQPTGRIEPARVAYEAYRAASEGPTFLNGPTLMGWDQLSEGIRQRWRAVVDALQMWQGLTRNAATN